MGTKNQDPSEIWHELTPGLKIEIEELLRTIFSLVFEFADNLSTFPSMFYFQSSTNTLDKKFVTYHSYTKTGHTLVNTKLSTCRLFIFLLSFALLVTGGSALSLLLQAVRVGGVAHALGCVGGGG